MAGKRTKTRKKIKLNKKLVCTICSTIDYGCYICNYNDI